MKLGRKLRHIWHELYYQVSPNGGVSFAMNCKDVTEKIDLRETPTGLLSRFRFLLHLSLCQACKSYLEVSDVLRGAIRKFSKNSISEVNIERLNKSLVQKHSREH